MNTRKKISGLAIATAAAGMFALATPMTSVADEPAEGKDAVQCMGANSCKGQSECKTANSNCKGLNECKGQGFVSVPKQKCEELGGTSA